MWCRKGFMLLLSAVCLTAIAKEQRADNTKGFYKDLFVDGGIGLTTKDYLPAAHYLRLKWESYLCGPLKSSDKFTYTADDTLMQRQIIGGSSIDENGILLYPDGQPRFRMIFMNGGKAGRHGKALGDDARNRIREFVRNGGSYVGDCAGMYLACRAWKGDNGISYEDRYLGLWPGVASSTGILTSQTTLQIEKKAALLKYSDFGGDMKVDSIYHNGGGYAREDTLWPKGTKVLARYDIRGREDLKKLKRDVTGLPAMWTYKADKRTGRIVQCGSHPEFVESGERLDLMRAMMKYAMSGTVGAELKGTLQSGTIRKMYCMTHDHNPAFTAIGDRQYHHFVVNVPKKAKKVVLTLKPMPGAKKADLYLLAQPGDFAYLETSPYKNIGAGFDKRLVINNPKAGKLYVSVFCGTTVEATHTAHGTQYSGRLDVLNGVPYSILAQVEE